MLSNLKAKIINIGFVRNSYLFLFKGAEKFLSRKALHEVKFNEKIDRSNKKFRVPGNSIEEIDAFVDPKLNSVLGWVPYLKGQTSIFVYHFFSTNYSIRKQVLVRLSIVKGTMVVGQKLFWFPCYSVFDFELENYFGNVDGDSVFVEMIHPLIQKGHGGDDGHLRAWGKYYSSNNSNNKKECSATTHTQHLNNINVFSHKFPQTRNYFSKNHNGKAFNYSRSYIDSRNYMEGDNNINIKIHNGFNVIKDTKDNPRAVWHHGRQYSKQQTLLNSNSKKITNTFWCPPSKIIDPRIAIDNLETGIKGENHLEIFLVKESMIVKKKKIIFNDFFQSSISNIFNEFISGPYYVIATFFRNSGFGFLHVNYDTNDNCGDNVHCHISNVTVENNKIKIIESGEKSNARKFFHFSKINEENHYYLIVHVNKVKDVNNPKIKIRVYTDKFKEYLFTRDLNFYEPLQIFELKKLFNGINIDMDKSSVVQIESTDRNYEGCFIRYNPKNETVAVDHLTGG